MGIIFKKLQDGSGGGGNVGIDKGQFLAAENQTSFVIQNTISTNDLLMIHVNNLYLEKDINYSISEDSISGTNTITLPNLKLNDVLSCILIKVGHTPIKPEVKKAICGTFKSGEILCGEGLTTNLSEEFLKSFG
ncbi:hypothetical protein [Clostridium perfringens]|uniref:hypothetical protein n=1 Tax=Clostridium perfringens TaxID=1502 RepID=UPI00103DF19D|nr:hypothetical protein [Clostridium perfringens]TBX12635.1 hypothetical protein BFS03_05180 [Clostridium perfringens]